MRKYKGTKTSAFGINGRVNHDSSKFYNSKLYKELNSVRKPFSELLEEKEFPKEFENKFILGSAENMKEIPNNSIHLVITSPPYNVSKEYDKDMSLKEYLNLLENSFKEVYRVLVNGGRACINVANIGRKPYIPLSDYISTIMIDIGFNMRGEIIWNKASSAGSSTAWGSWQSATNPILRDIHEYRAAETHFGVREKAKPLHGSENGLWHTILIFSKGEYKREKGNKENTISREQFIEWTKSIWNMNTESAKRIGHPAPFPEELPYRLIQLYSFKNDIILDPFMGSGTTAIAALKSDRKFIGYEINNDYIKLAEKRIETLLN